jgi:predicted alpha/beta-hydrolase family hydrolase
MNELPVTIEAGSDQTVSGLLVIPERATACYVMAHGAGAGMTHPFMASVAGGLSERGVATLRYQFPFMEHGSRRPDRPAMAQATVRAAVVEAARLAPSVPLFAGGKSFGARMSSQAQAAAVLPGVRGLAFIGFPLHPAGKPSDERARHLFDVRIPMLFLQGTRDALAETGLLLPLSERLGGSVTMRLIELADHSFHVPARSGRTDQQAMGEVLDGLAGWMTTVVNRTDD